MNVGQILEIINISATGIFFDRHHDHKGANVGKEIGEEIDQQTIEAIDRQGCQIALGVETTATNPINI